MLFNSIQFMLFFPAVVLLYFLIPHRIRTFYLLICSYYFYMCWNAKYAILLFGSTAVTYLVGVLIDVVTVKAVGKKQEVLRKSLVGVGFALNLSILFFFKYANFLIENLNTVLENIKVHVAFSPLDIILPVGISFYIFQALGYTIDVYRGDVKAERNFITYATFVSFFPQLVAGPIERSANLLGQFYEKHTFELERAKSGILLMLWEYFQKVVIADRISILVNT